MLIMYWWRWWVPSGNFECVLSGNVEYVPSENVENVLVEMLNMGTKWNVEYVPSGNVEYVPCTMNYFVLLCMRSLPPPQKRRILWCCPFKKPNKESRGAVPSKRRPWKVKTECYFFSAPHPPYNSIVCNSA